MKGNSKIANAWLDGIRRGDSSSIQMMYESHFLKMTKFVEANSGNREDAKDLFQESMFHLFQRLRDRQDLEIQNLDAYFTGMYRNRWYQNLKVRRRDRETREQLVEATTVASDEAEYYAYVQGLRLLGPDCQEVLRHYVEGRPMSDLAASLQTTVDYAKRKKYLCKEKLKKLALDLLERNLR